MMDTCLAAMERAGFQEFQPQVVDVFLDFH